MLRHIGIRRSFYHNLRLAILLCLNAGFINAAGFLAFAVLTTNVTGHAALLAVNMVTGKQHSLLVVGLWLFLFLAGAFCSASYIRKIGPNKPHAYTVPIAGIILVLLAVIFLSNDKDTLIKSEYFAGSLLFAMGMQNALVSMISGSVVRTTHLTGMFTDLSIDLSALIFQVDPTDAALKRRLLLRSSIILFFLAGGVLGGFCFIRYAYHAFIIPICLLILVLFGDYFRIHLHRLLKQRGKTLR
jgi:uncharacterized membrane protein YoaK (UPF0700 family)